MSWISPFALKDMGILGMNRRNHAFVARYNPRRFYPLVDNKLKTKQLAAACGVPTPTLRLVVNAQHEVKYVKNKMQDCEGFAIKPAKGSGGKGILVISGKRGNHFIKSSGKHLNERDMERHISNILAGLYSLGGTPDTALIEDIIQMDPLFEGYSHQGIPDIRVIVFQGYPVMAMLRLATEASDGKANLHQGAVGVGLDMATGKGLRALQFGKSVSRHPDTGKELTSITIPDWKNLLVLASRCYEMTGLGYIGADIVLDRNRGPLMLELNARPGLAIQMTNGEGLLGRLKKIEGLKQQKTDIHDRVSQAMELFGKKTPGP
ncbi:alpha-L-glutamate ligase-like protein [Desulfobotulus alkaliphilus]|uniref:Alpha-L-glutamate ligase-like protein n=1 Tax=Desulfobotulus alkaliphilus TaxID=622671 RepID=A0A562RVT0_9BACT|nr:alpha-L-glutamate ligase-like protein [Desulfobotulus alkaliphilus]TWI73207.1 alpha-L-glutamate ligase-like protein [Desulfobotulus alkaliphilus]